MTTSAPRELPALSARATGVDFSADGAFMNLVLEDGRQLLVPLAWFPRLLEASDAQRRNWRLIGHGIGIHWPDLDEDISVENLLA